MTSPPKSQTPSTTSYLHLSEVEPGYFEVTIYPHRMRIGGWVPSKLMDMAREILAGIEKDAEKT